MKVEKNTEKLYNQQADDWSRKEPILLSDYSARPFVLDLCEPLQNLNVLDIGCGEGYVGREMLKRGASHVHGIDISEKMIEIAIRERDHQHIENATYVTQDIRQFNNGQQNQYDLVMAMFLFNYLSLEETRATMQKIFSLLKPGAAFVFSVPHPLLAFLKKDKYPFYFDVKGGYFSGRDNLFPGKIWRRDGKSVNVQCVHKTVEDYFFCLKDAGFLSMPDVHELRINDEHIALDEKFFKPLYDLPLHMAFKVQKQ
jgi:2-polyprenyl-3-methyl-5-hydroxy-6-metoxy-1,4-benzoquinol methylase